VVVVVVDDVVVVKVEVVVEDVDVVVVVGHVRWSEVANASSSQNNSPAAVHFPTSAWNRLHLADVLAASTAAVEGGVTPGQVPTRLERTPSAPHVGAGRVADASSP
jgi:hypothetical protein